MGRWSVVHALGVVVLSGCGRLAFDEANLDAASDAPFGPFSAPQRINELSTTMSEDDPALPGDELELFFDSDRPGGMGQEDIWRATRPDIQSAWSAPQPVVELNSATAELSPGISLDGLTLMFSRNGGGGTGLDIFESTRPDRASAWTSPVPIPELSDVGEDTNPQLSADGLTVWFASRRNNTTLRQLWVATRPSLGASWNPPVAVDALNVAQDVYTGDPCPNKADTRLYFATDRSGAKTVWVVDRPTHDVASFGVPAPIAELATQNPQTDPWISPDEHRLYFAMHQAGTADLFVITR